MVIDGEETCFTYYVTKKISMTQWRVDLSSNKYLSFINWLIAFSPTKISEIYFMNKIISGSTLRLDFATSLSQLTPTSSASIISSFIALLFLEDFSFVFQMQTEIDSQVLSSYSERQADHQWFYWRDLRYWCWS